MILWVFEELRLGFLNVFLFLVPSLYYEKIYNEI